MRRFRIALFVFIAVAASESAESAERAIAPHGYHYVRHRTAIMLPAGLPRRHYSFRTTITYDVPYGYRRSYVPGFSVYEHPGQLYAPDYADIPYVPPLLGTPLLPGYYEYQGPYYGGPYVGYWDRLPYACGVYGYC
jgi:hypothetical protein